MIVDDWSSWTAPWTITLLSSIGYFLLWIQVTLWHKRGKFHLKLMWAPVIVLPVAALIGIVTLFVQDSWFSWVQLIVSTSAIWLGIIGTSFHLKSIGKRTGGYTIENFMTGPPFVLPLLISLFGTLNLLAILL
ncbi:hypothetical protein LC040_00340 [Bacillus tianshenii]|nr:hypothetical protein LC040_00340 [Bacillus tianshenii]